MSGTNIPNKVEAIKQINSLINQIDQIEKELIRVSNSTTFGDKMTTDQACEYFEIDEETFNRWVAHGFIIPDKQQLFEV